RHQLAWRGSAMNSWLTLMAREGGTRRWTDSQNPYERHIWRGALPTVQVEKKSPPPEVMTPVIYVPRESPRGSPPGQGKRSERKRQQREVRERHTPRTEAPKVEGEKSAEAKPGESRPPCPERPERSGGGGGGPPRGERLLSGQR